jgi:type II secretory pathway component PulF
MTSDAPSPAPQELDINELFALNQEIASLVRAGVPIGEGLAIVGLGSSGRYGRVARSLGEKLESGQSFLDAIGGAPAFDVKTGELRPPSKETEFLFPDAYRAVLAAGVRSGSLAESLEAVVGSLTSLVDARRHLAAVLLYPLLVLWVAWGALACFLLYVFPAIGATLRDFGLSDGLWGAVGWIESSGPVITGLAVLFPIIGTLLLLSWGLRSGRSQGFLQGGSWGGLGFIPGMKKARRNIARAIFIDLIKLLVAHETPLDQAIELAAVATGEKRIIEASQQIVVLLRRGESLQQAIRKVPEFPPLVAWVLGSQTRPDAIETGLGQAATVFRARGFDAIANIQLLFPAAISLTLGLVVALCYIFVLGLPWSLTLQRLAEYGSFM